MSLNKLLQSDWPQLPAQFSYLSTLRTGGVSLPPYDDGTGLGGFNLGDHVGDCVEHVLHNRTCLSKLLPNSPQWLAQVHGTKVLNLNEKQNDLTADACITSQPNVVCAVLTADCLPVLFCDPKNNVVGAAHAGWRGLADGVLENTIFTMQKAGADPNQLLAWLGPAIGPLKFEVGEEVRARFVEKGEAAAFLASQTEIGKYYADIAQLARLRLARAGIPQVAGGQHCTFSEPTKFYSYRRDGVTGRMASLIWINP